MKKRLLYILIGIPFIIVSILIIYLGYIYIQVLSVAPKNTSLEKDNTPEAQYNTLVQKGNVLYSGSTLTGLTLNQKVPLLEESLGSYSDALSLFSNKYTAKNLEFVQEQLRIAKLKQKQLQEKQTSEEEKGDSQKGQESEEKKGNAGEKSRQGEDSENSSKETGEEGESGKEGDSTKEGQVKGLSEKSKKALEEKAKELQEQQGDIGKFYNKNYKENNSRSQFDNFADIFGRQQFDNSLLDENGEKDW